MKGMVSMKNIYRMLVNEDRVICLNINSENDYASFVVNDTFVEVQPHGDLFYMVTLADDNTGDEYAVRVMTADMIHNLIRKL